MEFSFDINTVLSHEITLIRSKDIILDASRSNMNREKDMHSKLNLTKIIDAMGIASGKAQNLRGAITTALRMKSSDHHLYLLKESNANNGLGSVIGMLRVGYKHLFLVDSYGQQHECQPMCVLDFFVHETKQRHGYGKKIFNFMLRSESINPHELAIDRPSIKSINFLTRHFSLDKPIHQLNKFLVFAAFFRDMAAVGGINAKNRRSAPVHRKILNRTSSQQESRFCTSASSSKTQHQRTSRMQQHDLKLTRQLSILPPINSNENNNLIQNNDEHVSQRPISRQNERSHLPQSKKSETQMRSFSRHHQVEMPTKKSSPDELPKTKTNDFHKNPPPQCDNKFLETHSLQSCSKTPQHLTSLDNPFSSHSSTKPDASSQEDSSYTVNNVIAKINSNKERLGTSWNVFGVPNSAQMTSNPYSTMKRRGFFN